MTRSQHTAWLKRVGVMMAEDVRAEIVASVLEVAVNEGDQIDAAVVVLESMKTEIPVLAEAAERSARWRYRWASFRPATLSRWSVVDSHSCPLGDLLAEHTCAAGQQRGGNQFCMRWSGSGRLFADLSFADYSDVVRRDDGVLRVAQCRPNTADGGAYRRGRHRRRRQ